MASGTRRPPRPESPPVRPAAERGPPALRTRSGPLVLDRTALVGILNATPDSFSDPGLHLDPGRAAAAAAEMVAQGAAMLDVGAESTRPGATPVPADEERRRLLPVLRAVRTAVRVPISVDTSKAAIARLALDHGADVVNDVSAGRFDPALLPLCAERGVPVILMHMQGVPATMQDAPCYADVVAEVGALALVSSLPADEGGSGWSVGAPHPPDSRRIASRTFRSCSSETLSTASSIVSPAANRLRSSRMFRCGAMISAWVIVSSAPRPR